MHVCIQVALSANRAAVEALMNANHLSSQAEELAVNVTAAEERVDELGGVVSDNARVIAMATETAQTVSSDVSTLQGEIEQLLVSAVTTFIPLPVCHIMTAGTGGLATGIGFHRTVAW